MEVKCLKVLLSFYTFWRLLDWIEKVVVFWQKVLVLTPRPPSPVKRYVPPKLPLFWHHSLGIYTYERACCFFLIPHRPTNQSTVRLSNRRPIENGYTSNEYISMSTPCLGYFLYSQMFGPLELCCGNYFLWEGKLYSLITYVHIVYCIYCVVWKT